MNYTKVTTVVVTYNGVKWISKSINSLKQSEIYNDIIVVDNGSYDGTLEVIQNNFPEITLIINNKNLGFGQANNIGIKHALEKGAEFIFLLNQDAWVEQDTIRTLIDLSLKNPDFGIISPVHYNGSDNNLDRAFAKHITQNENSTFLYDGIRNCYKVLYETSFVNAAAWLLPSEVIRKVGVFDPIFFHYGEDYNYCQRVLYHGYKIGFSTKAKAWHDREFRPKEQVVKFSDHFYYNLLNSFKSRHADLYNFDLEKIKEEINNALKDFMYYLILLKFNLAFNALKEYRLKRKASIEIIESVERNKKVNL